MKFAERPAPSRTNVGQLADWAFDLFKNLAFLLNGNVLPDDQFNCTELEVEFLATPGTQTVDHDLHRIPTRVEVVRADQAGVVYVTASDETTAEIRTNATGTYRVRIS